ncbi:DNA-methyltransferase [Nocardia arizonensis]|uniref:DNA-methyltransferase n=1 Tax=Nocardia arizonensis TaxID=1141647 RepID=UPI0006D2BADC|nr:site-specific DNA-methyltransferase [Nocardia arizonensis]
MTPYYDTERATLYHGDALAVLAGLGTASVDAVITDPPYSSGGAYRTDRMQSVHTKYVQTEQVAAGTGGGALSAFDGDNRDQRSYGYWSALWIGEALRVVRPGGVLALFCDWRQLPIVTDAIQAGGFVWRGVVVWHKPNGRNTQGRYANTCEFVVWGTHGPRAFEELDGKPLPGLYVSNTPRHRQHITEKPLDVMRDLVRIVAPGGVLLDPFAGSGTTGVAAILEGRRFVGIEITDDYAAVAERRIRRAQLEAVADDEQPVLDLDTQAGGGR